ncbi:hypothetical protein Pcinc_015423 [Petrolisthes cinctipes]|uniref:Uncharacterized protein n=1 Tax=Petrolisthes cinctipes TaxID=88211 RepID=A0AAE1FUY8_PETCI|nr:hypothetical protein Pcinc_015423 [Petrolisthes cinctipes]
MPDVTEEQLKNKLKNLKQLFRAYREAIKKTGNPQLQADLPAIHQAVCEEEGVEGTAGDYFEMCRVTVKLLTRRRTQLKDFLSLFKGGMDTLLGDPTMTKRMLEVEKDTISAATVRKLKKYTESPKFVPDAVCVLPNGCPGDEGSCCSFVSLSPVDPVPSHPPIAHKPPTLR